MAAARDVVPSGSGIEFAVIVAVLTVRVMQVAVHQIIDVIRVWHAFMTTVWSMHVSGIV
jgi:hypothetical protein